MDCESDLWMDNPRRSNLIRSNKIVGTFISDDLSTFVEKICSKYIEKRECRKSENTFHSEAELVQAKENAGKWVILFLLCCSLMVLVRLNMLLVIIVVIVIINMIGIAIRVVILIIFDEPDHIDVVWMIILVQSHYLC